ncbi:MAG: O-antigen ligase family protein [Patescibacteria group bacterium]
MKKINIEKILLWIVRAGLCASLVLPFIVSKQTLFPHIFGRALYFQILIEVLLPFWAALVWFWPQYRPKVTWSARLTRSPQALLNWSILAFFAALILSTLLGADSVRSFWGTQERMTGVFTLLHFGFFYFMLISVFRSQKDWLWFLRGLIVAGIIISSHIFIYFGLFKGNFLRGESASFWFGNKGLAGSFLLFFVFLTPVWWFYERMEKTKFIQRIIFLVFVLTEFIFLGAVITNATRAVWVGLFIAAILGLLILSFSFKNKTGKSKIYKGSFLTVVIVLMLFSALTVFGKLPTQLYQTFPLLNTARSIVTTLNADNTRIMSWTQGLRSLKSKHILFGYGPENYYIAHNKPFNIKVSQLRMYDVMLDFDKAHNQPLENLVDMGIIGFLAYMLIFVVVVWMSFKLPITNYQLPIILLFIAYFIHLLFTFDTPSSYWLFFISLGLVYYTMTLSDEPRIALVRGKLTRSFSSSRDIIGAILITVLIIIIPISLYFINFKSYKASNKTAIAQAAANASQPIETSFNFYYQALQEKSVFAFEIRTMMAMEVLENIKQYDPRTRDMLMYTAAELEKNSKNSYHSQLMLGTIYNLLSAADQRYYSQALEALMRAQALAPSRHQPYTELFSAYLGLNKFDDARQAVEKALEVGYEPKIAPQFLGLAFIYGQTGYLDQSLQYYQKALEIEPQNIKILGSIAALHKEMGNKEKARQAAEQILKIEPAMEGEVREFLEILE